MDFKNVIVGSYIFQFCNQKSVNTKINVRQAVLGKGSSCTKNKTNQEWWSHTLNRKYVCLFSKMKNYPNILKQREETAIAHC